MQSVFIEYPAVPWKQGWRFASGPGDLAPLQTTDDSGEITAPGANWTLRLTDPSIAFTVRLLSNGLSLTRRKHEKESILRAILSEPGVLTGSVRGLPLPTLTAMDGLQHESGLSWVRADHGTTLLLCRKSRFALVTGELPKDLALVKAEEALEEDFESLANEETQRRLPTTSLLSINRRHNPPVALAAESLRQRLRGRTAALHGIWSTSDVFEHETFSLNELYPLIQAWMLIEPDTALELVQTALSLQQSSGGFPTWVNRLGVSASSAPWPMLIQSFELAWQHKRDSALLKKTLPALRKYMQWALRRFDPHRDLIPAWQSDLEVFIPENFERGKATPDLTVMLLGEIDALRQLCEESDHSEAAIDSLGEEHDQLTQTLTTIFWNPQTKAFSNVWNAGHFTNEPTFGSFLPLLLPDLPPEFKTPLLENFEETHGFPGQKDPASWKKEQIDDTAHLPAIHQFIAFKALQRSDDGRALLLLFVRRARKGFAAWFERESIEAARIQNHHKHIEKAAYSLGPVTAALVLSTQHEFQREAVTHRPTLKSLQRMVHRMRLNLTDLRIILVVGLAMILVHLLYNLRTEVNVEAQMSEAAMNYEQGQFTEAMRLCRMHPEHALSRFLQANLMMLIEKPEEAETLYHQTLLDKTESPSALFGYALALQQNGKFKDAARRYNDFLDIHEARLSRSGEKDLVDFAYDFLRLADAKFPKPPKWKQVYNLPIMNDLGL